MRFAVTFAHRRYLSITHALLSGTPDYQIPLGLYRQLVVIVEATDREDAIRKAAKEIHWPHDEIDLVPFGAVSQEEIEASVHASAPRAVLDAVSSGALPPGPLSM